MSSLKSKIVVITHSYFPAIGGVETFIEHFIAKLDKERYDVTVFTADKNLETELKQYQHKGIDVHVIKSNVVSGIVIPASGNDVFTLIKFIRNADFVHQHDVKFLSSFLFFFSFFFKYKLVLFSHGYMYHSKRFPLLKKLFMNYFSLLSKRYKSVINVSESDFKLAQKYNFSNSVLVKESVDLKRFLNNPKHEEKGSFLFFGRITKNKGLENLFRCLAEIKDNQFHLSIVGNGDILYIQSLKDLVKVYGLDKKVSWHHDVTNDVLLTYVSKAELVFLPSLYEGFGISLLESIASNTKILAHPNEAYKAMLVDIGLTEYLFDFTNTSQFESKINSIRNLQTIRMYKLDQYNHDTMVRRIEDLHFA